MNVFIIRPQGLAGYISIFDLAGDINTVCTVYTLVDFSSLDH